MGFDLRPPEKPSATQVQANTPELREAYGTCRLDVRKWAKPYKTSQAAPGAFHSHYKFQTEGGTLSLFLAPSVSYFSTQADIQLRSHPKLFSDVFQLVWRFPTFV